MQLYPIYSPFKISKVLSEMSMSMRIIKMPMPILISEMSLSMGRTEIMEPSKMSLSKGAIEVSMPMELSEMSISMGKLRC